MTYRIHWFNSISAYQRCVINKHPTFDIASIYEKLYEADGEKEVILTPDEADELLSYMQYIAWLTNPPEGISWHQYLELRKNEWNSRRL